MSVCVERERERERERVENAVIVFAGKANVKPVRERLRVRGLLKGE